MALQMGSVKKSQLYAVIGLVAVIVILAIVELPGLLGSPKTNTPQPAPVVNVAAGTRAASTGAAAQGKSAQKLSDTGLDPTLHMDLMAQTESMEYAGTGRNIFSAESAPVAVPESVASGRGNDADVVPIQETPPKPVAPPIDLKYFGYTQTHDKVLQAFFVHNDDIFLARTGEIVDHRYKVGAIQPTNVQVTDLGYNNTQTLSLMPN
jgi:hypothetical protein